MAGGTDLLFYRHDGHALIQNHRSLMEREIAAIDGDQLLNTSPTELVAYLRQKYLLAVPALEKDDMTVGQTETQIDVSSDHRRMIHDRSRPVYITGTKISVFVPFTGDPDLFFTRPSTHNLSPPRGRVVENLLVLELASTDPDGAGMRAEIDRWVADVEQYLTWLTATFHHFNSTLEAVAETIIKKRREKLLADRNLVAGLGIPMRERPSASRTFIEPTIRRKITPRLPRASSAPYKPEPVMDEDHYQHILGVLKNMVLVMERSPTAFVKLDEEGIRTHFLMQLNGQYEGAASGETFNYQGKTDILVRVDGRNVFIAECKFWGGPAVLTETIDQLLGYLSWRDAKAAILIFNRNKDFSKVLAAIPSTMIAHPNFRKQVEQPSETQWRYLFKHKDDQQKDITVTVMAFDIPQA